MKKIVALLSGILTLVSCATSKQVSYLHRPLAAEGCTVTYSVMQEKGELCIVTTVKSDRLLFGDSPTMMLKNFDGEILQLEGSSFQARSETGGIVSGSLILPYTEVSAIAQFPVSALDIPFFKSGISKVRITTVPLVHEKEFSKDYIGAFLYKALSREQSAEYSF